MSRSEAGDPPDLVCVECGATAPHEAEGWRAYLTVDEPPEVGLYCPDCAYREFK